MTYGGCSMCCDQVGMFPDVCEALALGHLARGDQTSAMVASEWSMRNNHFPGWGRPYEFAFELLQKVSAVGVVQYIGICIQQLYDPGAGDSSFF